MILVHPACLWSPARMRRLHRMARRAGLRPVPVARGRVVALV